LADGIELQQLIVFDDLTVGTVAEPQACLLKVMVLDHYAYY
jgi:hypothetical protein